MRRLGRAALVAMVVAAFLLEGASWLLVLRPTALFAAAPLYTLAHGGASALSALLLHRLLPARLQTRRWSGLLFLFSVGFFIPLLGLPALAAGLLGALYLPRRERGAPPWRAIKIPELPFRPLNISNQPPGQAVLVSLLRHSRDPERRLHAVSAARQMDDKLAVPILTIALKDPVDEVRLLAYALLDGKERQIYARIQQVSVLLAKEAPSMRWLLERRLAQDYWELAYLGLAQGDVLAHVLSSARGHCERALEARPDHGGLRLLLGRVLLRQGDAPGARRAIELAQAGGLPPSSVLPLLAEAAFRERRFADVARHLAALPPSLRRSMPMAQLAAYWLPR